MGTTPVWPPPSPPWAMTASTPHSTTFSAWRRAPIVDITKRPASRHRLTSASLGAWAKLTTGTSFETTRAIRSETSATSVLRFTPNGESVRDRTSPIELLSWSRVMVAEARMPSPPAAAVADTSRGPATHPMPVCTMG